VKHQVSAPNETVCGRGSLCGLTRRFVVLLKRYEHLVNNFVGVACHDKWSN